MLFVLTSDPLEGNLFSIKETTDFLKKLEDNESYIVDIGFIPNIAV
jgi:hypothetical protein